MTFLGLRSVDGRNKIIRNSDLHNYNTRNNSDYRLPGNRLKKIRQSYFYKGTELWNKINQTEIPYKPNQSFKSNLAYFKRSIKKKIISNLLFNDTN